MKIKLRSLLPLFVVITATLALSSENADSVVEELELDGLSIIDAAGKERIVLTFRDPVLGMQDSEAAVLELRNSQNLSRASLVSGDTVGGIQLLGDSTRIGMVRNVHDGQFIQILRKNPGDNSAVNQFLVNSKTAAVQFNIDASFLMTNNDESSPGFGMVLRPGGQTTAYGY